MPIPGNVLSCILVFLAGASFFYGGAWAAEKLESSMDQDAEEAPPGTKDSPLGESIGREKKASALRRVALALTGGLIACLCAAYIEPAGGAAVTFLFTVLLELVALVDMDTMEIPNRFVLAAFLLGLLSLACGQQVSLLSRILGIFSVSLPLLLITLAVPGAFGGGDIKLMAGCGFFLGAKLCLLSLAFAVFTGGLWGIWLLAAGKKGRKEHFAFGPFLCLGMLAALFVGEALWDWYLGFF